MGSRPLRMKVRWGCPPRVLSPPPHRTQSWRPCLPGQPWASGWRSIDRLVPSPRGWAIGFSERGAAHNRALPRCLSSQRCMRSWRHHDAVDGRSLGKHDLIVRFLKGARRMNPFRSPLVPSWDLSIVLAGLQRGPFEPLDSVELKFLSLKTALLTALTSIKWVGDLQAFSVSEECLVFGTVYSHVVIPYVYSSTVSFSSW